MIFKKVLFNDFESMLLQALKEMAFYLFDPNIDTSFPLEGSQNNFILQLYIDRVPYFYP